MSRYIHELPDWPAFRWDEKPGARFSKAHRSAARYRRKEQTVAGSETKLARLYRHPVRE